MLSEAVAEIVTACEFVYVFADGGLVIEAVGFVVSGGGTVRITDGV